MTIIPYNNETTGFTIDNFKKCQEEYAARRKVEDERKKQERKYNKETKSFRDELKKLRLEELENLRSNKNFVKRCEDARKNGDLTKDFYEEKVTGGCGIETTDLIYEYGSQEYKDKSTELKYEISKLNYLLYQ